MTKPLFNSILLFCLFLAGRLPAQDYRWNRVAIGGGGAITSIAMHPTAKDALYIGADVGGLDRWDAATQAWTQTLNFSRAERNLHGVEAIALDPTDPTGKTLYAAVGTYAYADTQAFTKGEVIKSVDGGEHWLRSGAKVWVASNWEQPYSQRLAVDPFNGSIVYHASREGLRRTTDGGATWNLLPGAPTGTLNVNVERAQSGVNMIIIDKSGGFAENPVRAKVLYIAPNGSTLFRSGDGGDTWTPVPDAPAGIRRAAITSTGVLYVTGSNGVRRYADGTWTVVTPPSAGTYGAISIDPNHDQHLVVARHAYGFNNAMFKSFDGGATWAPVVDTHTFNPAWYQSDHKRASVFSVAHDPFRPGRVWYIDWYLPWRTEDIAAGTVAWQSYTSGHEELVQMACMASPPAGNTILYSGSADEGGFAHTSLTETPAKNVWGRGVTPGWNVTGLDYQEANPNFVALSAVLGWDQPGGGAYSTDGGNTFTNFPAVPFTGVRGGRIAVSANSERIVWATSAGLYYSTNRGGSWTLANGLPTGIGPNDLWSYHIGVAADRRNGNKFYAYRNGTIYRSVDGGANWTATATVPHPASRKYRMFTGYAQEGDLWIALDDQGLYRSTDSGSSFAKVSSVQSAYLFNLGKGRTPGVPALYLMGKVAGNPAEAVYRSDDSGASWVKVSVPQPYPGNFPEVLVGDRRVYGRVFVGTQIGIYYGESTVDIEPPTAPAGLGATGTTPTSVTLRWEPATDNVGVTGYDVYQDSVRVATVAGTEYEVTGLRSGGGYGFYVVAKDALGNASTASNVLNVSTPDVIPPTVPGSLAASAVRITSVTLRWEPGTDNVGVTGYDVYRDQVQLNAEPVTTSSYLAGGLTAGTAYHFTVRARDAAGNLSPEARTTAITLPAESRLYEAEGARLYNASKKTSHPGYSGAGYVNYWSNAGNYVEWQVEAPYADAFTLEFRYANGQPKAQGLSLSVNGKATAAPLAFPPTGSYADWSTVRATVPLPKGSSLVRLTTTGGNSPNLDYLKLVYPTTDRQAPTVPAALAYTAVTDSTIRLTWEAATDNDAVRGYHVYANGTRSALVAGTQYTITGLAASTAYALTVTAVDAAGNASAPGSPLTVTTPDTQAPTVPAGLKAAAVTATTVTLSWAASADNVRVTGYDVYRDGQKANEAPVPGNGYTMTGLGSGVKYTFTVTARDAAGNVSVPGTPLPVTTLDTIPPAAPGDLVLLGKSATTATLKWTAATDNVGVTGYEVYHENGLAGVTAATTLQLTNLKPTTPYTFTVRAKDAAGNLSAASSPVQVTTDEIINLVSNPEFDEGLAGWGLYKNTGTSATLAVVTGEGLSGENAGKVDIAAGGQGTADWHLQLFQVRGITNRATYSISFMARAESNRSIRAAIQTSDNRVAWERTVSLTAAPQAFGPYTFTSSVTDAGAALRFFIGANAVDVTVDKVLMVEVPPAARLAAEAEGGASRLGSTLRVSPNPAADWLHIGYHAAEAGPVRVTLTDLAARPVKTVSAEAQSGPNALRLPVAEVPPGLYLLGLTTGSGHQVQKVVIRR